MRTIALLLFSLALPVGVRGQEPVLQLPPELAHAAKRHAEQITTLDAARTAAMEKVTTGYVAEIESAEKAASTKGEVEQVTALLKLRVDILAGDSDQEPPEGLTRIQQRNHEKYFAALESIEKDFAPKYDAATADHLKALASAESRLPASSPLRQQIADLKLNLVTDAPGGGTRRLANRHFDHTEWFWLGDRSKVWRFHPAGKITIDTGEADHFGWRIVGPDTFMITAGGNDHWKFTMDFDTMRANGVHLHNPEDKKLLIFRRKSSRR